ncbi:hypothetical protein CERZMDRAFT_94490 [Cercospora zeae-maydis SCOH1-5]|uniref:Uncharacterized protein n=1 Tax=Cercospora zeae-maydis SCOH1-5 TaxID=717836 RepID=A0A6A6FRR5_9PEZI|nr:hypothetical protein CERZMDRAFT_94490 [Cercospora zeae-maydis SCOH1-5]
MAMPTLKQVGHELIPTTTPTAPAAMSERAVHGLKFPSAGPLFPSAKTFWRSGAFSFSRDTAIA